MAKTAALVCVLLALFTLAIPPLGVAQDSATEGTEVAPATPATEAPTFAAPERIRAGEAFAGTGRLYPSPALHDLDGDGKLEMVIGDLFGRLTVTSQTGEGGWTTEEPLLGADGKQIKLSNW